MALLSVVNGTPSKLLFNTVDAATLMLDIALLRAKCSKRGVKKVMQKKIYDPQY